jgi:hypothetical protein
VLTAIGPRGRFAELRRKFVYSLGQSRLNFPFRPTADRGEKSVPVAKGSVSVLRIYNRHIYVGMIGEIVSKFIDLKDPVKGDNAPHLQPGLGFFWKSVPELKKRLSIVDATTTAPRICVRGGDRFIDRVCAVPMRGTGVQEG